ncbi:Uncharacterised protein [Candidatus Burarchaeum australiense]|nr:Uncharacterised protein [Candidatus Burarchaeum australiense]
MSVGGREVNPKQAARIEGRYDAFAHRKMYIHRGSPTDALNKLTQRLDEKGPKYVLPGNLETDKGALAIAALEILKAPYAYGHAKTAAFKALWRVYRADGAEVIEGELKRAGQESGSKEAAGDAKIVALAYLLENDPKSWQAISRALDTRYDGDEERSPSHSATKELNPDQRMALLNSMLAYAGPKMLNVDKHYLRREIGEILTEKAASAVADRRYVGAFENYLRVFENYLQMANEAGASEERLKYAFRKTLGVLAAAENVERQILVAGKADDIRVAFPKISNFYREVQIQCTYWLDINALLGGVPPALVDFASQQLKNFDSKEEAVGAKLMEAGKNLEGQKNYAAAAAAYETAHGIFESARRLYVDSQMEDRAELVNNKGLAALQTLDKMGQGLIISSVNMVKDANASMGESILLTQNALDLAAEAAKSTDVGDAAEKLSKAENARKGAEESKKRAEDLSADTLASLQAALAIYSTAYELYGARELAVEQAAVKENAEQARSLMNSLLAVPGVSERAAHNQ